MKIVDGIFNLLELSVTIWVLGSIILCIIGLIVFFFLRRMVRKELQEAEDEGLPPLTDKEKEIFADFFKQIQQADQILEDERRKLISGIKSKEEFEKEREQIIKELDRREKVIERHKDYLSEKAGYDVGWNFAFDDWMKNHSKTMNDF